MKDKLGFVVIVICLIVVEAGIAYVWSSSYTADVKQELENKIFVNLSNINISTKNGTMMFKITETNETAIKVLGPVVYIGLFNEGDREIPGERPEFNNIWKVMVENKTEHDAQLLNELSIGKNYTIWFINYTGFTQNKMHVSNRPNVLVDVEPLLAKAKNNSSDEQDNSTQQNDSTNGGNNNNNGGGGGSTANRWSAQMDFRTTDGRTDYVVLGEEPDALDGRIDAYDVAKPPASAPPYIRAWLNDNLMEPYNMLWSDYRHFPGTFKQWNLTVVWSGNEPTDVTISWNVASLRNSEYNNIVLLLGDGTVWQNMKETGSCSFTCPAYTAQTFEIRCN
jgi:hypothetical protein